MVNGKQLFCDDDLFGCKRINAGINATKSVVLFVK